MILPVTTPLRPACPAQTLAGHVAELMPARFDSPWTVEPCTAYWTTKPAARLVQHDRALTLTTHMQRTQIGWQLLPGRPPREPNLDIQSADPTSIAREVLRLLLPTMDDEAAARHGAPHSAGLDLLAECRHAMRRQGMATHDRAGLPVNSRTLSWGTPGGLRYSVTTNGTNHACDVALNGPLIAVLRSVPLFLPHPPARTPWYPLEGVRGRLARRMAGHLNQFTGVEQLNDGGLAIGQDKGPCGYIAPALDPAARVRDHTPVSVQLRGVGVDLLLSHAAQLAH